MDSGEQLAARAVIRFLMLRSGSSLLARHPYLATVGAEHLRGVLL
jgi:hypothetical protein